MNEKPKIVCPERKDPIVLARGLRVYLVGSYVSSPKSATVIEKYDWGNAVRIREGAGPESIVTTSDIITDGELHTAQGELLKKKLEQQRLKMVGKYSTVIGLWNSGLKTAKEMADVTHLEHPIRFVGMIKAAKRLGLIQ